MVVLENPYVTLEYLPRYGLVRHKYKQFLPHEVLKEALNTGTDLLIKYGATKWLSDNSSGMETTEEDAAWINTVWLPRTVKAGWKTWALVPPESILASMKMKQYEDEFQDMGVQVRIFRNSRDALLWIRDL